MTDGARISGSGRGISFHFNENDVEDTNRAAAGAGWLSSSEWKRDVADIEEYLSRATEQFIRAERNPANLSCETFVLLWFDAPAQFRR